MIQSYHLFFFISFIDSAWLSWLHVRCKNTKTLEKGLSIYLINKSVTKLSYFNDTDCNNDGDDDDDNSNNDDDHFPNLTVPFV